MRTYEEQFNEDNYDCPHDTNLLENRNIKNYVTYYIMFDSSEPKMTIQKNSVCMQTPKHSLSEIRSQDIFKIFLSNSPELTP